MKKLNIQLLIVTLCIAIPMIAVFSYFEINHNRLVKNELLSSCLADIQINVNQLDMILEMTKDNLSFITVDAAELEEINDAEVRDTDFWMNVNKLIRKLDYQKMISKLNMVPFVYFPKQDIFINNSINEDVTERLKGIIDEEKDHVNDDNIWKTLNINDQKILYYNIEANGNCIGAWVRYEDLYELLRPQKRDFYILSDNVEKSMEELQAEHTAAALENVLSCKSGYADFTVIDMIDAAWTSSQLSPVYENLLLVLVVFLVMFAVYIICIRRWIIRPINHLKRSMEIIQEGNLGYRIEKIPYASEEFSEVIDEFNYLMNSIESLKISIYEGELEQKEVRLEYLSRQIQPHFILNSLNTLYMYNENDPEMVKSIIKLISQYYRYVININSKYVALEKELEHIDNYIKIQQLRYPGRFSCKINCDEKLLDTPIPPFILESFVGNYFKHGMGNAQDNELSIDIHEEKEKIIILIEDNGPGFSDDSLDAIKDFLEEKIISEELGVGIRNSIERLELIYQKRCSLDIYNREEGGAAIKIVLHQESQDENQSIDH